MIDIQRKNFRLALGSAAAALFMVGVAFAAVPAYRLFCQVTGFGGTTRVAETEAGPVLDRVVKVRFSGSVNRDMPWEFRPVKTVASVRVGEPALAFFEAYNPTSETITGQATFNVTPFKVGSYFVKTECFCFTEQTLAPGERVDMPVSYYIDPAIADDPQADEVTEITLNYTFFRLDAAAQKAGRAPGEQRS